MNDLFNKPLRRGLEALVYATVLTLIAVTLIATHPRVSHAAGVKVVILGEQYKLCIEWYDPIFMKTRTSCTGWIPCRNADEVG